MRLYAMVAAFAAVMLVCAPGLRAADRAAHGAEKSTQTDQSKTSDKAHTARTAKVQPKRTAKGQSSGNNVRITSGDIRLSSGTVLHVQDLDAASIPRLDQQGCKHSTIQIHSGQLSLTDAGLTQLINHNFEKKGDKKRIKVTADGDKLKFEGSKAAGLSMTFAAKPTALGDGRIALVATDMKVEHLPVKGLLNTFGVNMDDLMHPKDRAISVDKDNIIVDLRYVSKDTPIEGHVREVSIEGERIIITFGSGQQQARKAQPANLKTKPDDRK